MNKKIKGFTIMEVVVTMLIAGLLIGITYTSYSIVYKSYLSFKTKNDATAVLVNLDHVLKRDFDKASIVLKNEDGVILKTDTSQIKYQIGPDFIIRISAKNDTFKVQTGDVRTKFENVPVIEQTRIDELTFSLVFKDGNIPCRYNKLYSSVNLIERNPDAGH
ncbi:MAG: type II secretion system protein J [Sphingobacteriales bacterium]